MDYTNEDDNVVVGENGSKIKLLKLLLSIKVENIVTDVAWVNNSHEAKNEIMNE